MPNESPTAAPQLTILGKSVISIQRWSRRVSIRWNVFLIVAFIVLLRLVVRSNGSILLWRVALTLTAGYLLWPFFQGAYLLHKNRTVALRAGYRLVDSMRVSELPQYRLTELDHLGFRFVGCLEKSPDHPLVTTLVAFFVHSENRDSAQLACVRSSLRETDLAMFATSPDDALVLETSNARKRPIFRPKLKFLSFRFPQVRNLADLYRLHKTVTQEYPSRQGLVMETPDEAMTKFIEKAEEIHSLNVKQGDYKLNDLGDCYVYTWKGAIRHSFLETWPILSIRQILAASDANKHCKRLGFRIDPKLGRILPLR